MTREKPTGGITIYLLHQTPTHQLCYESVVAAHRSQRTTTETFKVQQQLAAAVSSSSRYRRCAHSSFCTSLPSAPSCPQLLILISNCQWKHIVCPIFVLGVVYFTRLAVLICLNICGHCGVASKYRLIITGGHGSTGLKSPFLFSPVSCHYKQRSGRVYRGCVLGTAALKLLSLSETFPEKKH